MRFLNLDLRCPSLFCRICPAFSRVMKQRSDRLPAGKTFPIRGKGLPLLAAPGNAARFPRPRGKVPCRPAGPGETEASARPGGCKAPAGGGAGAGRWLWAPGGTSGSVAQWQGRWPLPEIPDIFENVRPGGIRKRDPRFPRPRGTLPCRPAGPGRTEVSARPGGREAPAEGEAGAGRGAMAPGWTRGDGALWQRRWPLPE
jgi:hypothetical protein